MAKNVLILSVAALFLCFAGCTSHKVEVAPVEIKPIHITIDINIKVESISTGNFGKSASRTWAIGPGISWSIFHGGAIRQNIKVRSALQEEALIQYESVVLGAQEEVENVLIAYAKEQLRTESLARATDAAKRAVLLARDQYQAGLVDFSNVLIVQRSLLSLQDQLVQSEGAVISNLVRLYKALGGGWKSLGPAKDMEDNLACLPDELGTGSIDQSFVSKLIFSERCYF